MSLAYYATKISENISRTPEGYLLCRNCVLARTGFQSYTIADVTKDLEPEDIEKIGLSGANPNSSINLYRPMEEVFSTATIASTEGKPFTEEHPSQFVTTENYTDYAKGHVQNVRKGMVPLDNGDWPLIGDIIINDPDVIEKVEGGTRELSCGYSHELEVEGDKICQVKIVVNHIALVKKGRAGPEARINDSAEVVEPVKEEAKKSLVATDCNAIVKLKRKPMAQKDSKGTLKRLVGMAIRAMSNDEETSPEELAEATGELHEKMGDTHKYDGPSCVPGVLGHEDCAEGKCMFKDHRGDDRMRDEEVEHPHEMTENPDDERAAHHAMLDRVLDKMGGKKKDSDVEELKNLLSEYFSEEEQEPEHAAADAKKDDAKKDKKDDTSEEEIENVAKDEEGSEVIEPIEEGDSEEESMEEMMSNDAAMELLPFVEKNGKKIIQQAYDKALEGALSDESLFLKKIRPVIAKSQDSALVSAFNSQLRRVKGKSKASESTDGYAAFGQASKNRPKKNDSKESHAYSELEAAYAKMLKGEVN